ncbi:hypothetical protein BVRB_036790, partial [Beta vulgaris subsp. vulgaris]
GPPGTDDLGSGHATPPFTEVFTPDGSIHPTATFTAPQSPHSIPDASSNGLSSVDALLLDLDLNLEDLPRLPDLPESPNLPDNHHDQRYTECNGNLSDQHNPIITTTSCPAEAAIRDLLRSVAVSEDDNRVLSNAQSLMQKLLEEMSSVLSSFVWRCLASDICTGL